MASGAEAQASSYIYMPELTLCLARNLYLKADDERIKR